MGRKTHQRAVLGGWRVQNRSETQEGEERVEQMTPISVSKDRPGGQLSLTIWVHTCILSLS